jgi:hypothetical protein
MEKAWVNDDPHAKFWRRLLNQRVTQLVNSKRWLQSLRYKNEEVRWWLKRCGHIFDERGINLYELIAQSHGEGSWVLPEYDEQKYKEEWGHSLEKVVPPIVKEKPRQNNAVSLDYPRQVSICSQEEEKSFVQVRPSDEGCKGELQKGRVKVV